jgi:hypothetical protein
MDVLAIVLVGYLSTIFTGLTDHNHNSDHTIDGVPQDLQVIIEQGKQLPTSEGLGAQNSQFGHAMSVDSFFAAIGAPEMLDQGVVQMMTLDNLAWIPLMTVHAADAADGDQFGQSVSLTDDYLWVGAPGDDDLGSGSGSVYVYERDFIALFGFVWYQQVKLSGSDVQSDDRFGHAVSVDGQRALVGAYGHDVLGDDAGAAYVFEYDGLQWQETAKLLADDGQAFDQFGWSVSLSGDRAVVGVCV